MATFKLEIEMDGPAFERAPLMTVARIVAKEAALMLEEGEFNTTRDIAGEVVLRDSNGNAVGFAKSGGLASGLVD